MSVIFKLFKPFSYPPLGVALALLVLPAAGTALAQINIVNAYPNLTFSQPIDYQIADSSSNFVYIAERPGRIKRIENNREVSSATVILDIRDQVDTSVEGGFLGFAFHPDYPTKNSVFVYYTAPDPFRSVISRFEVNTSTGMVDANSEQILLEVDQPAYNHNAGQIRFGPDGYLYIALGDGGGANDQYGNGQNRTTLLGSILRIDVDQSQGALNYAIPADNPFADNQQGYREEIYAYGFRNPYRFSFDSETGRLWAGDVGQNRIEEVDIVQNSHNYGWNIMEGSSCFEPSSGCDPSGLTLPVFEYQDRASRQSITGGFVYRGDDVPELQGHYLYADYEISKLWAFEYDGQTATNDREIGNVPSPIAFGEDQNRELYICSITGTIYTLETEPTSNEIGRSLPDRIQLHQNYPNPFNPTTQITFELPSPQRIRLEVYNSTGRLVQVVADRTMTAGRHIVTFTGAGLPSGMYFYRLETPSSIWTKKMTLLK